MFRDFFRHLFPRVVLEHNLRISYTLCLGGLAFTAFVMLAASGVLLLFYFQPTPETAYNSVVFLESSVWGGAYVRSLHRLSSHLLLGLVFLHTLRVILTGAYRGQRQYNWVIGFTLLLLVLFAAYTGCLLPMDQRAFWATQTGMALVEALPFGAGIRALLVPDGIGQMLSLLRFYVIHIAVLPMGVLLLSLLHFYRIRKNKGLLPYL